MAAYHKVEVSLNTNAVEVGIPSPQTVNVTLPTIGPAGPTGAQGPAGTGIETLTTAGDLLTRNSTQAIRLGIGATGQILKVSSQGLPHWAAEEGGVSSWNDLTDKPATFAPSAHASSHLATGIPAIAASYTGIGDNETFSDEVVIIANTAGTAGNNITLTFDGVDDVDTVLAAWNSANPLNQASLDSGDGAQVPDNGDELTLSGGVAAIVAGSDPIYDQDLNTTDKPTFDGLVIGEEVGGYVQGGAHRSQIVATGSQTPLTIIGGSGSIEFYKDAAASKVAAFGFAVPGNAAGNNLVFSDFNGGWSAIFEAPKNAPLDIKTGGLKFADATDNSKKVELSAASVSSGQTRVLTAPNASGTLALTTDNADQFGSGAATDGWVLTADGAGGAAWEAATGGGGGDTVSIQSTAADILSVSSGAISADDAGADRIVYWNNTNNKLAYGTPSDVGAAASSHTHSDATQSVAGFLSTADKTKLDGIASGAEVNVNADWNASSGDAQILNKPTLGTAAAAATTDFAAASHTHPATAISDSTTAGRALLTAADASAQRTSLSLGNSATLDTGTTAGTVATGNHSHELTALAATGATNGHVLTANGSGGVTFSAASGGGIGGSTGATDNSLLRADGTGGSSAQSSDLVIDDYTATTQGNITIAPRAVSFSATIAASDDSVTATGHTFSNGDQVVFTSLTGGAGLTANIRYFVRDAATNVFKVATTVSGAAVDVTTNYTAATVERIAAVVINTRNIAPFIVGPKPDGTTVGGNSRGPRSINIALERTEATSVASGDDAVAIGNRTTASGNRSVALGMLARSTGGDGVSLGYACQAGSGGASVGGNSNASGLNSIAIGNTVTASAQDAVAIGSYDANDTNNIATAIRCVGLNAIANMRGMLATRPFNAVYWGGQTTNNTATILNLDATATNRFTIAANTALAVDILLVARRSDVADKWLVARRFLGIRRNGSNGTSLIGTVQNFGLTDQTEGSPTWTFALTADDTNEALQLEVTGATGETVQWRACAIYRVV